MKPIRWSAHARKKAAKREISETEVEQTIAQPDSTMLGQSPRPDFYAALPGRSSRDGDAVTRDSRETDAEMVVVTLYKTSKFGKCETGA